MRNVEALDALAAPPHHTTHLVAAQFDLEPLLHLGRPLGAPVHPLAVQLQSGDD